MLAFLQAYTLQQVVSEQILKERHNMMALDAKGVEHPTHSDRWSKLSEKQYVTNEWR